MDIKHSARSLEGSVFFIVLTITEDLIDHQAEC